MRAEADKCCVAYGEIDAMWYKALAGTGMEIICAGEKQKCAKKQMCAAKNNFAMDKSTKPPF